MSLLARFFAPLRPAVAVEIASNRVSALRLGSGTPPAIVAHATEPLPQGAVVPGLSALNLLEGAVVAAAVGRVIEAVGRARHVALVVPDSLAKVSLVRFEQVPSRLRDLEAMLRWQVRKSVPFHLDDAQMTWVEGQRLEQGREFLVALARRDIIAQYEAAVTASGGHAGLVDLASFNLVNLLLAGGEVSGDSLLVHLAPAYVTLVILRDGQPIFYRHRGEEGEESLADLVHQTAMYHEDRLAGQRFDRVVLAGSTQGADGGAGALLARRELEERLGAPVRAVDFTGTATLTDRITASPGLVDDLAPLVGILSREPAA